MNINPEHKIGEVAETFEDQQNKKKTKWKKKEERRSKGK